MKQFYALLLLLTIPITAMAEWLPDNSPVPEFTIYRYPDSTYSTSEDITGKVILYAFGSIT